MRSLALTLVAAFAVPALAPLGATAHTISGHQHIHQKGSRLVRIKIRKRRVGSSIVVTPTTAGSGNDANNPGNDDPRGGTSTDAPLIAGTVSILSAGAVIASGPLEPASSGQLITSGPTTAAPGDPVVLTLAAQRLDRAGDPIPKTLETTTFKIERIDTADTEVAHEGGWIVNARLTEAGRLRASITHRNPAWDGSGVVSLGESGARAPLGIRDVRQRWSMQAAVDLEGLDQVTVVTHFVDPTGFALVSNVSTVAVGDALGDGGLAEVEVDETDDGRARLQAWTNRDATAALVQLVDRESHQQVHEGRATVDAYEASYLTGPLAFDAGDRPDGQVYLTLLDFLSVDGVPMGAQREVEIVIPPVAREGEYNTTYAAFDGGWVAAINGPEGYQLEVIANAADVAAAQGVNLVFEEPFEGPAPLETEVQALPIHRWTHYVSVAERGLPDLNGVTWTLLDREGAEVAVSGSTQSGATRALQFARGQGGLDVVVEGVEVTTYPTPVRERRAARPFGL